MLIEEAEFADQLARARRVEDLLRDYLEVLLKQAVHEHIEGKPQDVGTDKKQNMPENESYGMSG